MAHKSTYKTKQFFFVLIKLSIVVAAFYFIYHKLTKNSNLYFNDFILLSTKNHIFSLKHITFLLVLTLINWFFEIVKWQKLVSFVEKISFKEALEQSLGALTASLVTPNRIGEYGAKSAFFSKENRKRVMLINLLSNSMQMGVTTILGITGLYFFIETYPLEIAYDKVNNFLIIGVPVLLIIAFLIYKYAFKIRGFPILKIMDFIKRIPKKTVFIGWSFSLFRYLVFSFQFYYLLLIFRTELGYFNAMSIIASMCFLSSIIPSIFIFDVVIKGSVAVYLFSFLGVNELIVLAIVTLMWLFNFVLPSIIGSYYVLRFNFPKNIVRV